MDKTALPARGEYRVLICIMPAGNGSEVIEALRRETGVISTYAHHARGVGTHSLRNRVYSDEKQILTVMVEAARADDVFNFLYFSAGLDAPHAGMIMMGRAVRGAGVVPLPESESPAAD
ncbi:MAG: hypothetical protein IH604_05265 [Burkholderiales bacterium]|nr:hypothetical protein [Burkholderiales bacterium]